jgi:hypothetical protein
VAVSSQEEIWIEDFELYGLIQPHLLVVDDGDRDVIPNSMKIISFIEDQEVISKILKHLGLWDVKRKPPPCVNGPPTESFIIYDESSSPSADDPASLLIPRHKCYFSPDASTDKLPD